MSKAMLVFNIPEERYEFKQASNAMELVSAINLIRSAVKNRLKHGEGVSEAEIAFLDSLWEYIPFNVIDE